MKTKQDLLEKMASLNACRPAVSWVRSQEGTAQEIWDRCGRSDWMLWFAAKLADRRLVGLAACACARESLKYVPSGDDRPRVCIETTEDYWNGKASIQDVREARDNAAGASAVDVSAAAYAAAYADYVATYADDDAADDAADAADADAGVCADIVRTFIPKAPL